MTVRDGIVDRLARLGVSEVAIQALMRTFDTWDIPREPTTQTEIGRNILWIAMSPRQILRHNARIEAFGQKSLSAPMMRFATRLEVTEDLKKGYFGIAVNIGDLTSPDKRKGSRE